MKLEYKDTHVIGSSGIKDTKTFSIRTSAHAFKMLSSGLYSDKIAAVLREIGCNAADAHKQVKNPAPFEVKLPNRLDSQFYIKDHGPGLAHDDVMTLYSTYFESTKQGSNDQTGGFGLGSKSPFSYTDSFVVESVHGGKKRIYSAYIGNNGSPQISMMAETDPDPDWKNGIKVGFPVPPKDFDEFSRKAASVFEVFTPIPKVTGGTIIVTPKAALYEDDLMIIYKEVNPYDRKPTVIMGNVRYPLAIGTSLSYKYNVPFSIKMPIGSLSVAASREELQYDASTVKALEQAITTAAISFATKVIDKYKSSDQTWAGKTVFIKENEDLLDALSGISASISMKSLPDYGLLEILVKHKAVQLQGTREVSVQKMWKNNMKIFTGNPHVDLSREVIIVYGNEKVTHTRIRYAFEQLDPRVIDKHVILVYPSAAARLEKLKPDCEFAAKQIEMATLTGVPMYKLSDFPLPPASPTTKISITGKSGKKVKMADIDIPAYGSMDLNKLSSIPKEGKVYVLGERLSKSPAYYFRRYTSPDMSSYYFSNAVDDIISLNHELKRQIIAEPYLISSTTARRIKLEEDPEWISYADHIEGIIYHPDNEPVLKAWAEAMEYAGHYGEDPEDHTNMGILYWLYRKKDQKVKALFSKELIDWFEYSDKCNNNTVTTSSSLSYVVSQGLQSIGTLMGKKVELPAANKIQKPVKPVVKTSFTLDRSVTEHLHRTSKETLITYIKEALC